MKKKINGTMSTVDFYLKWKKKILIEKQYEKEFIEDLDKLVSYYMNIKFNVKNSIKKLQEWFTDMGF